MVQRDDGKLQKEKEQSSYKAAKRVLWSGDCSKGTCYTETETTEIPSEFLLIRF